MAGLDDYRYYSYVEKESPFWVKKENRDESLSPQTSTPIKGSPPDVDHKYKIKSYYSQDDVDEDEEDLSSTQPSVKSLASSFSASCLDLTKLDKKTLENTKSSPWLQSSVLCLEYILSHPFIVLRRQCQVHIDSSRRHYTPFTLASVVISLHKQQGATVLWKGLGSTLIFKAMNLWMDDFLARVSPWPKSWQACHSLKSLGQHILLKSITLTVTTSFYSASLVESVQSNIASETPGFLDVFREGLFRMFSWTTPQTGRMLPVWTLVVPTVIYGISHYVISSTVSSVLSHILHSRQRKKYKKKGALPKDPENTLEGTYISMLSRIVGNLSADVLIYPVETILNRLHLQGTRTIVDNLETGYSVVCMNSQYVGLFDCFRAIKFDEGFFALFQGFGALVTQYALQLSIYRSFKAFSSEIWSSSDKDEVMSALQKRCQSAQGSLSSRSKEL